MSEDIDDDEEYSNEDPEVSVLDSHCRIGKVTFKDHKLVSFPHTLRPSKERQEVLETVVTMLDGAPENFDGWVVMGWNKEGNKVYSSWDAGSMPYVCLPEFVKERVRKAIDDYENGVT